MGKKSTQAPPELRMTLMFVEHWQDSKLRKLADAYADSLACGDWRAVYEDLRGVMYRTFLKHGTKTREAFQELMSSALADFIGKAHGEIIAELKQGRTIEERLQEQGFEVRWDPALLRCTRDEVRAKLGAPEHEETKKLYAMWSYAGMVIVFRRGIAWRIYRK